MYHTRVKRVSPYSMAQHYCGVSIDPEGIVKKTVDPWIGYGLFAAKTYSKGEFIAEYRGVLCSEEDGAACENDSTFQYYFSFKGVTKCIDATNAASLAKYANDDSCGGNSSMKVLEFDGQPHLCLFASTQISSEDEIRYDYGVKSLPWRIPQNKDWPHKLVETVAVSACSFCNYPMSSVKWNGLTCFDCTSVWHETCFAKLSVKERCCESRKMNVDHNTCSNPEDSNRSAMLMLLAMSNPAQPSTHNEAASTPTAPIIPFSADLSKKQSNDHLHDQEIVPDSEEESSASNESEHGDETYDPSFDDSDSSDSNGSEVFVLPENLQISHASQSEASTDREDSSQNSSIEEDHVKVITKSKVKCSPYKKPYRFCPFCDTPKSKLSQHIAAQHKELECVAKALNLPKNERVGAMKSFKKDGILKVNKQQAKSDQPIYERERSSVKDSTLVMCSHCSGFYAKSYIKRHTVICQGEAFYPSASIPVQLFACEEDYGGEFVADILCKFRRDDVGKLCTSDPVLLKIGRRLWFKQKGKNDKKVEVRRSVMTDMRRLGSLYSELLKQEGHRGALPVKEGNLGDIFHRNNFAHLEDSIETLTTKKEGVFVDIKAGLKMAMYYLLKSAAKILKATYLMEDRDGDAENIDKFVAVLELNHNYLFGDAAYKTLQQRQVKLRRPESLPLEEDIKTVRLFTLQKMSEISASTIADFHNFVQLRDLVVCRLTLFNARRGGEPSRLLLREWQDAEQGAWIDANQLENLESVDKALASSLRITYQSGKGNKHLVPVLFPEDTVEPIRKLCSQEWRLAASINEQNPYLFPSTNASENHVSGWYAVNQCCEKLELKDKSLITATKNRHRVSTLFAMMDVPEADRQFLYKHLGHSEETNKSIYQTPLAIKELTVVGKRLQTIDETSSKDEVSSTTSPQKEDESMDKSTAEEALPCKPQKRDVRSTHIKGGKVPATYDVTKVRKYSKWTTEEADTVKRYFKQYYDGTATKKLPGRKDVLKFLARHPTFQHNWSTIHSKIMNDLRLQLHRAKKREMEWL